MAITYPLSLPSSLIGLSNFKMGLRVSVAQTSSPFSFSEQVVRFSGEIWECEFQLPLLKREEAEDFNSFILKLRGKYGTFLLGDPNASTPRGSWAGTPVVDGADQTGDELNIKGLTPSQTGIAKAGDYIQLGSGSSARLHKVLEDADSDGSGNATLLIAPNLRESPADEAALTTSNAKGVFRLAENYVPFTINSDSYYSMRVRARESL